jgi:hypothetical protein
MALASGVDIVVVIRSYQQRLLVRKSVGSNPTLINIFACFCPVVLSNKGWASSFEQWWTNTNDFEQDRMTSKELERCRMTCLVPSIGLSSSFFGIFLGHTYNYRRKDKCSWLTKIDFQIDMTRSGVLGNDILSIPPQAVAGECSKSERTRSVFSDRLWIHLSCLFPSLKIGSGIIMSYAKLCHWLRCVILSKDDDWLDCHMFVCTPRSSINTSF